MTSLEFEFLARTQFEDLFSELGFKYSPSEKDEMLDLYLKLLNEVKNISNTNKLLFIIFLKELTLLWWKKYKT